MPPPRSQGTCREAGHEGATLEQEALPGLAREPRQIALPVEQPAYVLPEAELLRKSVSRGGRTSGGSDRDTAAVLVQALAQFGVEARVIGMVVGPRVTRYELQLAPGTKVSKVSGLKDDLAYALASTEIRILAPIPGKSAVGVEVPNQRPDFVTLGDIYREFPKSAGPLMVWLGKDISGKAVYADLTKLPHLLIAGTTGSGKSGCVNCLVSSVLLRSTPGAGAHDHDRPQEGRALALRPHPPPAGAGGDQHEGRRRSAPQRGQGDGGPLRADGAGPRPQPARR